LRAGWQTNFIAAVDYVLGNRQSSTIPLVSVIAICSKRIVKRSELERESDIEQLRRIALVQHGAIETLVEQLRAKCKALAKFTGTSHAKELQQTLALVANQGANQPAAPAVEPAQDNDPSRDDPQGRYGANSANAGERGVPPRRRNGPTPQPALSSVTRDYTLPADQQSCDACGGALQIWPDQFETSELIDVTEVRFELVTVQRQKYRCACQACIVTAPGPERAVAGSRYALDLALKVVVDKYMHSLPLTRQAAMFAQLGLVTSSSTLWELVYQIGTRLELVSDALLTYALQQRVVGIDETSWPRLDDASRNPWQMWAITVSGLGTCAVAVHRIRDDKGAATMTALIGDFNGVLVCDQAATHGAVDKHNAHIELAGCWAHIMRRFKDAAEDFPMASVAADLIRMLYDIDATLADKRQALQGRTLDDEAVVEYFQQLLTLRQLASRDVCAQLHVWLLANRGPTTISIHDAVEHTLKYWLRLTRFLDDPMIPLDNNATERAFRGPVVGRKNYYGAKSRSGTQVAATFFTLIETCKLHGVPALPYLRAACLAADQGRILLPWDFAKAANPTAR
jgi:transposase